MPEDDEDDEETLPHSEAVDVFQEGLAMVVQDPLLCDLPIQVRAGTLGMWMGTRGPTSEGCFCAQAGSLGRGPPKHSLSGMKS